MPILTDPGPVYAGLAQDWKDRFTAVGGSRVPPALVRLAQDSKGVEADRRGVAVLKGGVATVWSGTSSFTVHDPRLANVLFAGWTDRGPVVQGRDSGGLYRISRSGLLATGIVAPFDGARLVQDPGGPELLCEGRAEPYSWRPSVRRDGSVQAWPWRRGSFGSVRPFGGGLLVTEDRPDGIRGGEIVRFFRPGRRTRTVLRTREGAYLAEEPSVTGVWVALPHYGRGFNHTARWSEMGRLSPTGRFSQRFRIPFELRPYGLDDSGLWLLGIRVRALHGPNQDLVAIRLRDHAVRTLREDCQAYDGLKPAHGAGEEARWTSAPGAGAIARWSVNDVGTRVRTISHSGEVRTFRLRQYEFKNADHFLESLLAIGPHALLVTHQHGAFLVSDRGRVLRELSRRPPTSFDVRERSVVRSRLKEGPYDYFLQARGWNGRTILATDAQAVRSYGGPIDHAYAVLIDRRLVRTWAFEFPGRKIVSVRSDGARGWTVGLRNGAGVAWLRIGNAGGWRWLSSPGL